MPAFKRYIGIDYSGAETPTSSLKGLRVYLAEQSSKPAEVPPPASPRKYWTRRGIAEWLVERLNEPVSTIVGIDHGFSFPMRYFESHHLEPNWAKFLDDFQHHWPTDDDNTYVDFVRDGIRGHGALRTGASRWRRICELRARAKSVFHFDVQGSVAKSTHAGIPWLRYIRQRVRAVHFWPFDDWSIPPERSAIVEVYPSLWRHQYPSEDRSGDQHDAYAACAWLQRSDVDGTLLTALNPQLAFHERAIARVEGWILGLDGAEAHTEPNRQRSAIERDDGMAPPVIEAHGAFDSAGEQPTTDWVGALRTELRTRAERLLSKLPEAGYRSLGAQPTILFFQTDDGSRHVNFFTPAWMAIRTREEWRRRLTKRHTRIRALPADRRSTACELDSSNSSDALLMNLFCAPGAAARGARVLEASPQDAAPVFGWNPRIELTDATFDATEIDMQMGDTLVEAKLTERNFTSREQDHVRRYRSLESVFEVALLPVRNGCFEGYQLIRNVLAAAQHDLRLAVVIDSRRPDLLHEWWMVHAAIRNSKLRSRCRVRFWQELAAAMPAELRSFLRSKYGL